MVSLIWAGQLGLVQRWAASPGRRTTGDSQTGHLEGMENFFFFPRPQGSDHLDNFRDDLAGPLDHDRIADADILSFQFVLVVQRGPTHFHPSDHDRL